MLLGTDDIKCNQIFTETLKKSVCFILLGYYLSCPLSQEHAITDEHDQAACWLSDTEAQTQIIICPLKSAFISADELSRISHDVTNTDDITSVKENI